MLVYITITDISLYNNHFTAKLAAVKQANSICLSVLYTDKQVAVPHTSAWNVSDCACTRYLMMDWLEFFLKWASTECSC